jgi:hypothetical protein
MIWKYGIHVNCNAPTAATQILEGLLSPEQLAMLRPELVSPGFRSRRRLLAVDFPLTQTAPHQRRFTLRCSHTGGAFGQYRIEFGESYLPRRRYWRG